MKHYINSTEVQPRNIEDIGISVDFSKDVITESVNIDNIILPLIGREEVMKHLQNIGISEGIPYFIDFTGKKMPYYIDLLEGLKVRSNEVEVKIKQRYAHDNFIERADGLTFDYLNTKITIPTSEVGYKIIPPNATERGLIVAVTLFAVKKAIADQVKLIEDTLVEFAVVVAMYPASLGQLVKAIATLAIQIAYLVILVYEAYRLIQQLVELVFPKTRFFKVAYVYDLLKLGCQELGYTFKSTILETTFQRLAVISVPQNKQKKKFLDYIENELNFAFNTGYPTISDSTPTLGSLFKAMQTMFNAKIKVRNKVVEFERWDYWKNNSNSFNVGLSIQDKALDEYEIDTSRMFKRYLIKYQTDFSDISTYDNFEWNASEYSNEVLNVVNKDLNCIKGLTDATIPFAMAKRKDKLTWLDKQFKGLFKFIDKIAKTNYANKKDPRGVMIVTQQFFAVPKLIIHDGGKKIAESTILSPSYLWNNYHSINMPDLYQYIIRDKVPLPMTEQEFLTILDNNYANINGKTCEVLNIEYLPMQNKALISYREKVNLFKNNTKVIKIY